MVTQRTRRVWIEVIAAAVLLTVAIGWIFPRFIASQRTLTEGLLQNDLDTIFSALRSYHQDWNGYLPSCLNPPYEVLDRHYDDSGLFVNGYPPTFQLSPECMNELIGKLPKTKNSVDRFSLIERLNATPTQALLLVQMQFGSSGYPLPIRNFAIAFPWPYSKPDDYHEYVNTGTPRTNKIWNAYEQPNTMTSIIDPADYFNPSNGLDSNGFVYQDLLGNRSMVR